MKFTLDSSTAGNYIRGYSGSELRIGTQRITRSCIVSASALVTDWEPATFDALLPGHLERLFELSPEVVLLGSGPTQRFASAEVRAAFARRGLGVEVMQLGAACRTFNVLLSEERRVVAGLFLG